jgi:hypothetical protein
MFRRGISLTVMRSPSAWSCRPTEQAHCGRAAPDQLRACSARDITPPQRKAWLRRTFAGTALASSTGWLPGPALTVAMQTEPIKRLRRWDRPAIFKTLDFFICPGVEVATYWAAVRRWPKAKITLRQGARVVRIEMLPAARPTSSRP